MAAEEKGFFGALFDLSFSSFVTTKLIKVLYLLIIAIAALGALGILASAAMAGGLRALIGVVVAPIVFILWVLGGRVWLELIIVMFRIAENVSKIAEQKGVAPPES
ncbi:MAG: DUF4282 domain-containing protein [Planctomycetes bacterium]|nr:DUF4282 domain-containing protein [Planctomycetota bacterium]